jgi:CRP-like cAMP-binding protein
MDYLKAYIEDKIDINEDDWAKVVALFTKKEYIQGEEIFRAGEVCQKLYYISSGVGRMYSINTEGKDLTWALNYNKEGYQLDPFSGDYVSYLTQTESAIFCEALSECTVYEADFAALDTLYESDLKWMTLAKKISDTQLVTIVQRMQMMNRLTAKEKYELMKVIAPIYEEVLPDYQFATVLGIAPQSLSRIKNS